VAPAKARVTWSSWPLCLSPDPIELVCQANLDAVLELSADTDLRLCRFLGNACHQPASSSCCTKRESTA
jgi:hypothetical protein